MFYSQKKNLILSTSSITIVIKYVLLLFVIVTSDCMFLFALTYQFPYPIQNAG